MSKKMHIRFNIKATGQADIDIPDELYDKIIGIKSTPDFKGRHHISSETLQLSFEEISEVINNIREFEIMSDYVHDIESIVNEGCKFIHKEKPKLNQNDKLHSKNQIENG